jgi:hypothetical protein
MKVIQVLEGLQQTEHLKMLNQQKSATDSARIRGISGDSTDYCFRDIDEGSWHQSCGSKIRSAAPGQQQKEFHAEVAQDLHETSNNKPHFLKQVITGD